MDKLKERWEFIIGYVALFVSLSAFKDELTKINLNIGITSFSAAQFLFILIIGFFITLHFYLIPFLFSSTKWAYFGIFTILESISYFLFVLLALSPFLVFLAIWINLIIGELRNISMNTKTIATIIIQLIVGAAVGAISGLISDKFLKQKYSNENQKLEDLGIKDFEITQKLFADGYYSQSILEAFKCLEIHLKRLVLEKGIYLRTSLIQDVIQIAKKNDLLSEKDIAIINNIRNMRNSAAHLDIDYTKQQADEAIIFIKELIKRNTNAKGKTT